MFWIEKIKRISSKCWNNAEEELKIPEFEAEEERRYRIIFLGLVQGVGFRYEVWRLAEKIGITGFAENLPNGNVLVEAQGGKNRLLYLVDYMKSIPRIYIEDIQIDEIEMKEEKGFYAVY